MEFEEIKQLANKSILTIDEIKIILDYIVNNIKLRLKINDASTRMCKQSSMAIWDLCDRLNIPFLQFNTNSIGMSELEHHFGITGFQTEYGQVCFLLDLTYIQFTEEKYGVLLKNKKSTKLVLSPGNFISEENKNKLLDKGYLILTEQNFDDYISSFIETYRLANSIDERIVYDEAYNLLQNYGINLADNDYLKNQSITY